MSDDVWIGIDLGTQSVRTYAVAAGGRVAGSGTVSLPASRDGDRHEQDPLAWWDAVCVSGREALRDIAPERVRGVGDGERLDLGGGRQLRLLHTPGHAKHHIAAYDDDSGALFVGDSVGVKLPGMTMIRPATPPPDFDLVLAHRTLDRYKAMAPKVVYLAHYGAVGPPLEALDEADERLRLWAETAEAAYAEHAELDHVTDTLARRSMVAATSATNPPPNSYTGMSAAR